MGHCSARRFAGLVGAFVAVLILLGAESVLAADTPPTVPATPGCDAIVTGDSAPTVTKASNAADGTNRISLGDIVTVEGNNLGKLFGGPCAGRQVVLFMNDWPLKDVKPVPPVDPALGKLKFKLVNKYHADSNDNNWVSILGRPDFSTTTVSVSVGFANGFAMQGDQKKPLPELQLQAIPGGWFLFWLGILIVMIGLFFFLAICTSMLRDAAPAIPGAKGPYSLSRTQGAVWFFVILAAYLFIGLITGDFSESINSTALILLGIGAGTVVGSAVIDVQKDTEKAKADRQAAVADVSTKLTAAQTAAKNLTAGITTAPAGTNVAPLQLALANQNAQVATLQSQLNKLQGASENFIADILSDANGVSFHRYQIAMWTVVLSVIFIVQAWENLAMPTFNTTLMGLLGLSAGTYLGLKIPEPTTPSK